MHEHRQLSKHLKVSGQKSLCLLTYFQLEWCFATVFPLLQELHRTDKRRSLSSAFFFSFLSDSSQDRTSRLRFYEKPKHQDGEKSSPQLRRLPPLCYQFPHTRVQHGVLLPTQPREAPPSLHHQQNNMSCTEAFHLRLSAPPNINISSRRVHALHSSRRRKLVRLKDDKEHTPDI